MRLPCSPIYVFIKCKEGDQIVWPHLSGQNCLNMMKLMSKSIVFANKSNILTYSYLKTRPSFSNLRTMSGKEMHATGKMYQAPLVNSLGLSLHQTNLMVICVDALFFKAPLQRQFTIMHTTGLISLQSQLWRTTTSCSFQCPSLLAMPAADSGKTHMLPLTSPSQD